MTFASGSLQTFWRLLSRAVLGAALMLLWLPVQSFAQRGSGRGSSDGSSGAQAQPPASSSEQQASTPAGDAQNGKKLWNTVGCYECHGYSAQGGPAGARLAPNPPPFSLVLKYVRDPKGEMPPFTSKVISDAQLADIYAYLKSIPNPPEVKDIPLLNEK